MTDPTYLTAPVQPPDAGFAAGVAPLMDARAQWCEGHRDLSRALSALPVHGPPGS
jgi:hypothetical protein